MVEALAIDFAQPVPLFPLPNCVLLPHATVPLHIFEPRYRQMVNDALDSRGLIAMGIFQGQAWRQDYQGNPPVRRHVCVGYIVRHHRLPDGRFQLLLQGACRARIIREVEHAPYRLALLRPTERQPVMEIDLSDERHQIEELLNDPLLRQLSSVSAIHNWLSEEIPTTAMSDLATMTICDDGESRYRMLEEGDARARLLWLEQHLKHLRRTLRLAERFGNGQSAEGWGLN